MTTPALRPVPVPGRAPAGARRCGGATLRVANARLRPPLRRGESGARGFTLIELVVTLAIIAILASAALPLAELAVKRGKESELRHALREIRGAIDEYKKATADGRVAKAADATGYPPSLDVLVAGVDDKKDPKSKKIYFLRRIPRDPFNTEPVSAAESWGRRSYESPPDNPRPGKDVFDVFSLSEGTGINGVPYREW